MFICLSPFRLLWEKKVRKKEKKKYHRPGVLRAEVCSSQFWRRMPEGTVVLVGVAGWQGPFPGPHRVKGEGSFPGSFRRALIPSVGIKPVLDFKEHPIILSLEKLRSQQYEMGRHELSDHNRMTMPHMDSHHITVKAGCGLPTSTHPGSLPGWLTIYWGTSRSSRKHGGRCLLTKYQQRKPQESSWAESKLIVTIQIAWMSFCFAPGCKAENRT